MTIGVMKKVLLSPNEEGFRFFCPCALNEVDSREVKRILYIRCIIILQNY